MKKKLMLDIIQKSFVWFPCFKSSFTFRFMQQRNVYISTVKLLIKQSILFIGKEKKHLWTFHFIVLLHILKTEEFI